MTTYGYEIRETTPYGVEKTSVSGCDSIETAQIEAVRMALYLGWTPPQWWQFWRWGDTKPSAEIVRKARERLDGSQ